jgi:predicted AlkP superfamily pyrophosphatase or phosphodiesterase
VVASLTVRGLKKVFHKVFFLIAILCTPFASVAIEPLNNVVIISIDALHPDALQRAKIPNFSQLMPSGAYSLDGRSTDIDDYLASLIALVKEIQRFLIVITSDHAGHGKIHGSSHPDDYRLPLTVSRWLAG